MKTTNTATKATETSRTPMTLDECHAALRVLDAVTRMTREIDLTRGIVTVWMTDSRRGNIILREVASVPTAEQAAKLIKGMRREFDTRAKGTIARVAAINSLDKE